MLRNKFFGLWGFLKLSTLLIVFFLMLGFYFWGEKAKEVARPWIEESRRDGGMVFYGEGIWNKMKGIQSARDKQSQRSLELVGGRKVIKEKSNRYSLEVPEAWIPQYLALGSGGQMSKIILTSPSFVEKKEGTLISIEDGARLTISAIRGEQFSAKAEDGGHGSNLLRKEAAFVPGMGLSYHAIQDSSVKKGNVFDLHVLFEGNTYLFRYEFNSEKFDGGEFTFQELISTLKFGK